LLATAMPGSQFIYSLGFRQAHSPDPRETRFNNGELSMEFGCKPQWLMNNRDLRSSPSKEARDDGLQ
jgi:hypothetical protein